MDLEMRCLRFNECVICVGDYESGVLVSVALIDRTQPIKFRIMVRRQASFRKVIRDGSSRAQFHYWQ